MFRSRVEPVELAVALKRECDDKKSIGPVQTLVPNDFVIDLGPSDHERLAPYILTLGDELADIVREHGSEQRYTFLGPVGVTFHRDPDLTTGSYRVGSRVEAGDEAPATRRPMPPAPATPPPFAAPVDVPVDVPVDAPIDAPVPPAAIPFPPVVAPLPADVQPTRAIPRPEVPVSHGSLLLPGGDRIPIRSRGLTIGRGQECDVRIADASVSRRHAAFSVRGDRVVVEDLDSTNGTTVNGERVRSAELADGDRVTLGAATITYRS